MACPKLRRRFKLVFSSSWCQRSCHGSEQTLRCNQRSTMSNDFHQNTTWQSLFLFKNCVQLKPSVCSETSHAHITLPPVWVFGPREMFWSPTWRCGLQTCWNQQKPKVSFSKNQQRNVKQIKTSQQTDNRYNQVRSDLYVVLQQERTLLSTSRTRDSWGQECPYWTCAARGYYRDKWDVMKDV